MAVVVQQERDEPTHQSSPLSPVFSNPPHVTAQALQQRPVVVVGNGPVGMRAVSDIFARNRKQPVVLYGKEEWQPYDRIKLSSWLVGDVDWQALVKPFRRPFGSSLDERFGVCVTSINLDDNSITDSCGQTVKYHKLILATGSSAYVPDIPGIEGEGVYTLRNLSDALNLMARRARSHHTVVIGGGLLGLETARGMQPMNTQVTIVEHSDRLMANQLDERSGQLLKDNIESMGFDVIIGDGIKEVLGTPRISGVRLHSGRIIDCDTIVVATGIRPHLELARQAGLAYGRGITVDDRMRTSHRDIYAVGECAEHRGNVYGLVAPGYEQAGVAASDIAGKESKYSGSIVASRLKVIGKDVFSVGPVGHTANPAVGKSLIYEDAQSGVYRKLLIDRQRLTGAIGLGEWPQSLRVQTSVTNGERVHPWQRIRFKRTGNLWPADSGDDVLSWPDSVIVCQCTSTTRGRISEVIAQGSDTIEEVGTVCGAGSVCGSCKPLINQLLGNTEPDAAIGGVPWLVGFMVLSTIACALILFSPVVPYASSVQSFELLSRTVSWHWDNLWRSTLLKQITGFTVLGAIALASTLSLRKRWLQLKSYGSFDGWRIAHLGLSVIALIALLLHTGFRMGHGLNFYLMSLFVALSVLGVFTAVTLSYAHQIKPATASTLRKHTTRWHIYLAWPIPVLLGWHILKGYWY